MTEKIRLQRYLASAGVAARRKAEELIVAGHVRVNGKQVRLLGTKVDPVRDQVTVSGEAVHPRDNFYVLLNKPKGCVTAVEDDRGRPTVMEYLPNLPIPVRPVGRLDFYAEGVVLLTNDGDLSARLVSGQRHIPKTYHVKVRGELHREHLEVLRNGVLLEDGTTTLPAEVNFLPGQSRHAWVGVTVIENKQHQVQRMMEALGYQVQKLQCVAFATLTFHGLRVGDARELTQLELNALRDLVDLDHSAAARGAWRTYREDTDIPRRAREKLRAEAAEAADSDTPAPEAWREADDDDYSDRPSRRDDRSSPRDDRAPRRAEDRAPRRPDDRAPRRPEDRAPRKSSARDDRAPRRPDDRRAAPSSGRPRRPDDRAPRRDDASARPTRSAAPSRPRRDEDRAPRRPDDRRAAAPSGRGAPRRPEDRAPRRPEDRAPRRPEDRAPRRPDDRRAAAASPSRAPSGRPAPRGERSAPSFDTGARPASRGTSFGARAPSSRPAPRGASFGPPDRPSRPRPGQPAARPSRPAASRPSKPRRK